MSALGLAMMTLGPMATLGLAALVPVAMALGPALAARLVQ